MADRNQSVFVPVLTVMVDYGNTPFLWFIDDPDTRGVGTNLCDGVACDASCPMSEGLWREFADWATAFERTAFHSDSFDADDWDWIAFHVRGIQLARGLKQEAGDTYRIVYKKPYENPNRRIDERSEILADGKLMPLPSFRESPSEPLRICQHIVSGGQTGADRSALDFAIKHGYTHGGWSPHGRKAEDGFIPLKYQLTELVEGGYRQRTRRNVEDSDATLIINLGELEGGTLHTRIFAQRMGKPYLLVQLDSGVTTDKVENVMA